jgi:hypothetical protein
VTRPPIPKKLRAEAMAKNEGYCTWQGCTKPGTICEHILPFFFVQEHKLENLEPRCRDHAAEKTVLDQANIGHVRRMAGESGPQKRLRERKAQGLGSRLNGHGFDKTKTRGFDGKVRARNPGGATHE